MPASGVDCQRPPYGNNTELEPIEPSKRSPKPRWEQQAKSAMFCIQAFCKAAEVAPVPNFLAVEESGFKSGEDAGAFLKAGGVSEGVKSYDLVVDLITEYEINRRH